MVLSLRHTPLVIHDIIIASMPVTLGDQASEPFQFAPEQDATRHIVIKS